MRKTILLYALAVSLLAIVVRSEYLKRNPVTRQNSCEVVGESVSCVRIECTDPIFSISKRMGSEPGCIEIAPNNYAFLCWVPKSF